MEKHEKDTQETDLFHQQNLRKIIGVMWVTNTDVLKRTLRRRQQDIVGKRRFWFVGHVLQMAPGFPAHSAIDWIPFDGRKRKGRPRKTRQSTFCDDLHARGVSWSEAE